MCLLWRKENKLICTSKGWFLKHKVLVGIRLMREVCSLWDRWLADIWVQAYTLSAMTEPSSPVRTTMTVDKNLRLTKCFLKSTLIETINLHKVTEIWTFWKYTIKWLKSLASKKFKISNDWKQVLDIHS